MLKNLQHALCSFLSTFHSGENAVPFLDKRKLVNFYFLVPVAIIGAGFNISFMLRDGFMLSALLQGLFLFFILCGLILFWATRKITSIIIPATVGIFILLTDIILSGGNTYGIGVFYVIPAFPLLYLLLGFRSLLVLSIYYVAGILLRVQFGSFPPTSLFANPVSRQRALLALIVTSIVSLTVILNLESFVKRLVKLAFFDSETGLPGKITTKNVIDRHVMAADKNQSGFSIVGVHILNDTRLNAMLGMKEMEGVLKCFTERLYDSSSMVRYLGRWNCSFFLFILETDDFLELDPFCRGLLARLSESCPDGDEHQVSVLANLTVTRYPEDAPDSAGLLGNLMSLQDRGRSLPNEIIFFRQEDLQREKERFRLTEALLHADFDSEMSLHYQPKMDLRTGLCSGAEVLLRWNHPELGSVSPADFIPLAEESGQVKRLTRWIILKVLTDLASNSYQESVFTQSLVTAINLSVHDLKDDSLVPFLIRETGKHGFKPEMFEFEITEGVLVDDNPWLRLNLQHLREQGFGLAIDDFGTGYSSLSYLHKLKVDNLKIDQSFVASLTIGEDNAQNSVVDAIISMAHALSLNITAEGAETEEQVAYLKERGCHTIQGWYFSKSLSFEDYLIFLKDQKPLVR